ETYAEDIKLYTDRALGNVKSGIEILDKIAEIIPIPITVNEKNEILIRRENRMRNALISVKDEIINTLIILKDMNLKIGLISNADIIDKKYWNESPLAQYFDVVIFSCDVGLLKTRY
ncbi:MAG TPA: haloacid dehalogenase, partial [Clostridiales bacterium]|nr:haloacid dehalogenase [Clostridiales bacterium]